MVESIFCIVRIELLAIKSEKIAPSAMEIRKTKTQSTKVCNYATMRRLSKSQHMFVVWASEYILSTENLNFSDLYANKDFIIPFE